MSDSPSSYSHNLGNKFRTVASVYGDRPALRYPDETVVSYRQLDDLSDAIARLLVEQGLHQGDVVGIFHDKSPEAFASMIACLKCGLIYTNLDPDSPWPRLRKMLETCAPKLIVNPFPALRHASSLGSGSAFILHLRDPAIIADLARDSSARTMKVAAVTGAAPAYIMFTSGSTGVPKGAVISHGNVLNFISWAEARFQVTPADTFSNVNPMFFDNSVFDFYVALFTGATLAPISPILVRDPRELVRATNIVRCTIWFSVPPLLVYLLTTRALAATDFPSVRKIIFGGEGFPKTKLKQLYDLFGKRAELENVYGPTECTCICSAHTVTPADFADMKGLVTLGFLSRDFSYVLLGPTDTSADEGELFLGGPNVGLGYFNDPERTATAFIQNPTHCRFRDIGYRTGDLVRRDESGRLHFLGRKDLQIKHMGYRVELEEVETALATLTSVSEAAVIYRKFGDGLGELVGFAALSEQADEDALLHGVREILPAYMVPRRIMVLESLPRTANGKIDRVALQDIAALPR